MPKQLKIDSEQDRALRVLIEVLDEGFWEQWHKEKQAIDYDGICYNDEQGIWQCQRDSLFYGRGGASEGGPRPLCISTGVKLLYIFTLLY